MIITDIYKLDARMIAGVQRHVRRCEEEGVPTATTETRRELSTQIAYHLRGRGVPYEEIRLVFARCSLWAITEKEAATISTGTLYSKHIDGLAVDRVPLLKGRPWWDAPLSMWELMWKIAEDECGLDACAGGKWEAWKRNGRPWDLPHYEFRTGI